MRPVAAEPVQIYRYSSQGWEAQETGVIEEASVALAVNGEEWLTFTCTPTHLEELCVGFLFNEGVIQSYAEVQALTVCADGSHVDAWLSRSVTRPGQWRRTSGCTGGVTMAATDGLPPKLVPGDLTAQQVRDGMSRLLAAQTLYRQTRGLHCSTLFDGVNILQIAEDIGRHNTLDKLAGMLLKTGPVPQPVMVFTTGRVSSEMLQKSARMGAMAVISRTSPTTLSIQMAEQLGVTLIGYARGEQFSVYSHPERLMEPAERSSRPVVNQADSASASFSA